MGQPKGVIRISEWPSDFVKFEWWMLSGGTFSWNIKSLLYRYLLDLYSCLWENGRQAIFISLLLHFNCNFWLDVSDMTLNTERRAVDRDEYEIRKKAREAQLAELSHERESQKIEEERAAIAKLRAEMVHKSNPIRKFKQVVLQGSEKPPTCPESPRFSDRLRSKVRV